MSTLTPRTKAVQEDCADPPRWFDAHNHIHDPRLGLDAGVIIQAQRKAGVVGCVVNATCEADWPIISALAEQHAGFIHPAFGIHPWKAHTASAGWQDRLRGFLDRFPQASVGECGIDSWISEPAISIQSPVFLDHLRIARETQRPITIHCLKAWGHLFDCLKREAPPSSFLMHSFAGSVETARRLVPMGAYFSVSGYFLHERKHQVLEMLRDLPEDRLLLETDAPDMLPPLSCQTMPLSSGLNHPANAASIGTALAARFDRKARDFADLTRRNALAFLAGSHSVGSPASS